MNRILVSDETEMGLRELRSDHESGAQALAVKALEIILNSVQKGVLSKLSSAADFWKELRWMAWHLGKNGRPSMAAAIETQLFTALNTVKTKMKLLTDENKGETTLQSARKIAEEAIKEGIAARKHTLQKLAESFTTFIQTRPPVQGRSDQAPPIRVVTLSSSGTITQCLSNLISVLAAKKFDISLSVLESRPNFEGVSFVNTLLQSLTVDSHITDRLRIEVVSDASMAMVTRNADYLLLGGDKVLPNGNVCNKMGSLSAAIVAKTINPKCHVIAAFDTSKITATASFEESHEKAEYNDEAEMVVAWPNGMYGQLQGQRDRKFMVEVKNAYFEWVEAKWIDTYISEEGVLGISDIERLGKLSKEIEDGVFSDL